MVLTQVKVQSINDVNIPSISSNKLRVDAIRLVGVYVCDDTHDEILVNIFSMEELYYNGLVLEG